MPQLLLAKIPIPVPNDIDRYQLVRNLNVRENTVQSTRNEKDRFVSWHADTGLLRTSTASAMRFCLVYTSTRNPLMSATSWPASGLAAEAEVPSSSLSSSPLFEDAVASAEAAGVDECASLAEIRFNKAIDADSAAAIDAAQALARFNRLS